MMTKKELSQLYYLRQLKKEAEMELERLMYLRGIKAVNNNGMPGGKGGVSHPTEDIAIVISEQMDVVRGIELNCQQKEKEIWKYISELEDVYLASIIKCRCIDLLSWKDCEIRLGGSADSIRKYFERHIS